MNLKNISVNIVFSTILRLKRQTDTKNNQKTTIKNFLPQKYKYILNKYSL